MFSSQPGFEPGTFGLEVQRAIHCATETLWFEEVTFKKALQCIFAQASKIEKEI